MATEDFSTYDETDVSSRVTKTSDRVTHTALDKDEEAHVSDSKGVGHFSGDFTHRFRMSFSETQSGNPFCTVFAWAVSDVQETQYILDANGDSMLGFEIFGLNEYRIYLVEIDAGDFRPTSTARTLNLDTEYWCELSRSSSTYTYSVWSDDYEGTLVHTESLTLQTVTAYEYVYGLQSREESGAGGKTTTGWLQFLDLLEAGGGNAMPMAAHHYEQQGIG